MAANKLLTKEEYEKLALQLDTMPHKTSSFIDKFNNDIGTPDENGNISSIAKDNQDKVDQRVILGCNIYDIEKKQQ